MAANFISIVFFYWGRFHFPLVVIFYTPVKMQENFFFSENLDVRKITSGIVMRQEKLN